MVELVGTEYPMPDDDLPRRDLRGDPYGDRSYDRAPGDLPHPTVPPGSPVAPPPGSPAVPSRSASGSGLDTAWRRWREAVAAVHAGLGSEELPAWELQEIFDAERSARRVCAAVLRVAGHDVPDYLADTATLTPLWPEPERPA
jgi:hypothetical protein